MAPLPSGDDKKPFNVLVTGFGPFRDYPHNPSWLGVQPLHNTTLSTATQTIHFTCFRVPTSYAAILSLIPPLHARPPILPSHQYPASPTSSRPPYDSSDPAPQPLPTPPERGYDLVIHVGAGMPGALALEAQAHKTGYRIPDWDDRLPPIVHDLPTSPEAPQAPSRAEWEEMRRAGMGGLMEKEVKRGFAEGYEGFPEILRTEGDVLGLVDYLRSHGYDFSRMSTDAGHYCCDFIYYCSLAESQRPQQGEKKGKASKVQFMHIPPPGKPYEVGDVTGAVRRIAEFYALQAAVE